MANATARKPADSLQAQVLAFARRAVTFAYKDEDRPAIACVVRVADSVWCATDGHRLAFLPAPAGWVAGNMWPENVCLPARAFADLCAIGLPSYAPAERANGLPPVAHFAVGDDTVRQEDHSWPNWRAVVPVDAYAYRPIHLDMTELARVWREATASEAASPADRLRAGGLKLPRVGYRRTSDPILKVYDTPDGVTFGVTVPHTSRELDEDGVWRGKTTEDYKAFGADVAPAGKPLIGITPLFLLDAFGDTGTVTLNVHREHAAVSIVSALYRGEYHLLMPMRL